MRKELAVPAGTNAALLYGPGAEIRPSPFPLQTQVSGWLGEAGQQEETHLSQVTHVP